MISRALEKPAYSLWLDQKSKLCKKKKNSTKIMKSPHKQRDSIDNSYYSKV